MIDTDTKFGVYIDLSHAHPQASEHFYDFDYHKPKEPERLDYRLGTNIVGHFQRQFLQFWAVECGKHGDVALDLGGGGVWMPWVVSADICAAGQTHPVYGGTYHGVHVACDASNLSMFGTDTFGCVLNSHLIEHLPCDKMQGLDVSRIPNEQKRLFACPGTEVIPILRNHWLRVLKPGGILAIITPDAAVCDVFGADKSHTHAWSYDAFKSVIIDGVADLAETIEFESITHFSMHWVAKKK